MSAPKSDTPRKPLFYVCPAGCGCRWRDNHDGTMSLFDGQQKSCSVCEPLPLSKLTPVGDPNHDIVPTLRMFDGLMMSLAADEIEGLRSELAEAVAQRDEAQGNFTAALTTLDAVTRDKESAEAALAESVALHERAVAWLDVAQESGIVAHYEGGDREPTPNAIHIRALLADTRAFLDAHTKP